MGRLTGSWLDGAQASGNNDNDDRPRWRGERLGIPRSGSGSVSGPGRRLAAFLVDIALASLVSWAFTAPAPPGNWSLLAWFVITVVPVTLFGATPGMVLLRIWVARLDGGAMVGPWRAVVRAALTFLLIPAAIWNFDGRAWHDRLTGTIVLNR
ncbi:RDD family protein [Saccharopolyspora erythraea]|uniref:RDD family protein n=1 Tax=Saccharopolyspora erythraea TaxID=1836 RepID=UPI001BEDCF95|nr:RDD family protein [Saccharopolyspora erythraea]